MTAISNLSTEKIRDNIAYNLKQIRKNNKLSQKDLGKILEVSYQQVQKYESGMNRISAIDLFIISNFLNLPIEDFYRKDILLNAPNPCFDEKEVEELTKLFRSIKNNNLREKVIKYCSFIERNQN